MYIVVYTVDVNKQLFEMCVSGLIDFYPFYDAGEMSFEIYNNINMWHQYIERWKGDGKGGKL